MSLEATMIMYVIAPLFPADKANLTRRVDNSESSRNGDYT